VTSTGPGALPVVLDHAGIRFGSSTALADASFSVRRGTICGLLAPSGGGKTTTLRLVLGLYTPTSGSVALFGRPAHHAGASTRQKIGYAPQGFVLYPELTVRRNLEFVGRLYRIHPEDLGGRIDAALDLVELQAAVDRPARDLSGGMLRRLQLAAAILHRPELLVIDEPTAGVDPLLRAAIWSYFGRLRDAGTTLIVSTQYVTEAEDCDSVVILRDGRVVANGSPEELWRMAYPAGARGGPETGLNFEDVFLAIVRRDPQ